MNAFETGLGWWVLSVVVLFFKMHALAFVQLYHRNRAGTFRTPEDVAFFSKGRFDLADDTDIGDRATRAWRNDLENLPAWFAVSLGFVLTGGSATAAAVYCGVYTVARVGHTLAYLKGVQPHRFLCHITSLLTASVMAIHTVVRLF